MAANASPGRLLRACSQSIAVAVARLPFAAVVGNRYGRARRVPPALILASAIGLGGCAQITVVSDDAPPRSEWKFGVLAVDLGPSSNSSIVSASGVGVISSPTGTALGYSRARIVRLGDECRVVVTGSDLETISKDAELLRLLKETQKACAT